MRLYDVWTLRKGRLLHRTTHRTREEALAAAGLTDTVAAPAHGRFPRVAAA